jgi:hypothetical protein
MLSAIQKKPRKMNAQPQRSTPNYLPANSHDQAQKPGGPQANKPKQPPITDNTEKKPAVVRKLATTQPPTNSMKVEKKPQPNVEDKQPTRTTPAIESKKRKSEENEDDIDSIFGQLKALKKSKQKV